MKISVVFTGGTIGSHTDSNGVISPEEKAPFKLIDMYKNKYGNKIHFQCDEPYKILSENLATDHLNVLIKSIRRILKEDETNGIIITHGTDTLQYSAAILSYVFGNSKVPVVLVSSAYPLEDKRANGFSNFECAVGLIENGDKGVFVSYANEGMEPQIHRGTRLLKHEMFSADLHSVMNSWYKKYENGVFIKNINNFSEKKENLLSFSSTNKNPLMLKEDAAKKILWITPHVPMNYPEITDETKVILHESYHSGTICLNDDLKKFALKAKEKNIPFFITGLLTKEAVYETVKQYKRYHIVPLGECSVISQYCKLWLALSNDLDINKVMNSCVAYDHI